ncbi:Hypothetical protein FKW44_004605 [Caligus rogercresseyi]|uniref:Uncharacterized protein n=1 Tax=Caligus rogercresseyi TaxID=217165 RepID=A0A7T8HM28_CALRO|nr:Hypothetical protein FKW44_004605 [Caligus rogercresseyi]
MTPPGALFGIKDGITSTSETSLMRAGLPSLNELATKAVDLETWKCFHSNDGGGGAKNPVGDFVFPIPKSGSTTPVAYPLGRETATFVMPRNIGVEHV